DKASLAIDQVIDELGVSVGEALMTPTLIYSSLVRQVLGHYKVKNVVHGIGHITGGGLLENTQRILPSSVDLVFERGSWDIPPLFSWLQRLGQIDNDEMTQVFNMGIGLTFIVNPYYAKTISDIATGLGLKNWVIGKAVSGSGKSRWQ
ncbi:MAG: AIR synthase-related protein, partial [Aureliella sp.]